MLVSSYTRYLGLLALHCRLLQQAWSLAMRLFSLTITLERAILRHVSCCHKYFCEWQPPKVLEVCRWGVTTERRGEPCHR